MRAYLAYEDISLEPFRELPQELCERAFFRASEHVNRLIDAAVEEVLAALDIPPDAPAAAGDAPERAGVAADRREVFRWLFEWARDGERTIGIRDEPAPEKPLDLAALVERVVAEDPSLEPNARLISIAAGVYPDFLRGRRGGEEIFLGPGMLSLWESFFSNRHRVVRVLNLFGAHAVAAALGPSALPSPPRPLRILELGGGLGSAAEALLERFGPAVGHYLFTDIHPGFLGRGGGALRERFPGVPIEVSRLDINRPFADQGVRPGEFDIIYAVNAVHLAVDLLLTLESIRAALAPGGSLVFVEGIRPAPHRPIAAEFVFQLLPQFRRARTHPEYRPRGGFMAGEHWIAALRRAGFDSVRALPDLDAAVHAYPNHYMGAFIGRA